MADWINRMTQAGVKQIYILSNNKVERVATKSLSLGILISWRFQTRRKNFQLALDALGN